MRRLILGLAVALALVFPVSAGAAFPYLTLNAARSAINRYEYAYWHDAGERAAWRISSCDHEALNSVLVWCLSRGSAYPEGGRPERWSVWEWAELMPNGQIEVGEEE